MPVSRLPSEPDPSPSDPDHDDPPTLEVGPNSPGVSVSLGRAWGLFQRFIAFAAVVWMVGGVTLAWLYSMSYQDTLEAHGLAKAEGIGKAAVRWVSGGTDPLGPLSEAQRASLSQQILTLADVEPLLLLRLYDRRGALAYSTDPRDQAAPPRWSTDSKAPAVQIATQSTYVFFGRTLNTRQASGWVVPLSMGGWAEVHIDHQANAVIHDDQFSHLAAGVVMVLAGMLGVVALFSRAQAQHGLRVESQLAAVRAAHREATTHLAHLQDAMETTIGERTLRLQQSEARFREFAESASDWLWECDTQGRISYLSEGFSRILGVGRDSVLGRFRWELSDNPEDEEKWASHRQTLASMRPFRDFTYSFRVGPNRRRVVSLNGTPIFDEQAHFCGYRGTGADVTAQYEARQTILHLGRVLEQSSSELFIVEGSSLRILQANRGARRNLGYGSDDLAQLTMLDILPAENRASLNARLGRLRLYPGELATFEAVQERKDGTRYPVEARIQFMAQEEPPVFVVVAQNITARKQAEQALAESEERYRSVAEMSLDAIVVHVDGVIVFANLQATTIFHAADAEALIGQSVSAFVRPEDQRMLAAVFFPQRREEHSVLAPPKRTELTLLRADGGTFEAELSSLAITFGGRPAVQTVLRDITQSKAVQSQLIQTAKLATLGEMAAGMAHELSQPMNVIRMAAESALLDSAHGGTADPASRTSLEIVSSQAARMGEIIDHMRIFSRKQSDETEIFDAIPCVHEAVAMVESQLRGEDISIHVDCAPAQARIEGRPVHLEQVLLNLLTNARDSLRSRMASEPFPAGSRAASGSAWQAIITLSVRWTDFAGKAEDSGDGDCSTCYDGLEITVEDSGTGIPSEVLDRIFEPFFTTKEVGTGTGLGLSVSFSLISSMRGTMEAFNTPSGACFRIRLPLTSGETTQEQSASMPLASGAPSALSLPLFDEDSDEPSALIGHILVVDDEPFATALVRDHLVRLGYRVTTADDGEEAFEKALDDPPDLMITDLRMPRCDGRELIRRVHAHLPGLPVIVVTGHLGHLETAAAELKEITVAVLKKPISLGQLGTVVQDHVVLP